MMRDHFIDAASHYTTTEQATSRWEEIEACYHEADRYYHTHTHLDHVLNELFPHKSSFTNWHTVVFAVAYHDAIYNPLKNNNEEKSAALADNRLSEIKFPQSERVRCRNFILATKNHLPADEETNLLTDADLSILGAEPEAYSLYAQQIRREYRMYPDLAYNPGRKKVLQHFLAMPRIYKTDQFYTRYEISARMNLQHELEACQR